jgi:hypothetical protein
MTEYIVTSSGPVIEKTKVLADGFSINECGVLIFHKKEFYRGEIVKDPIRAFNKDQWSTVKVYAA